MREVMLELHLTNDMIDDATDISIDVWLHSYYHNRDVAAKDGIRLSRSECYTRNIDFTLALIETAKELGYWFQIHSPFEAPNSTYQYNNWFGGFTPHGQTGFNGRPDHQGEGKTMQSCIARAFLKLALARAKEGL